MTTDAFSLNFSFEDEKNTSSSSNAVPNSPEENDNDELLDDDRLKADQMGGDQTENFDASSFSLSESEPSFEVESDESSATAADANDPFAGFSFGFGAEPESLDDLPSEIGTSQPETAEDEFSSNDTAVLSDDLLSAQLSTSAEADPFDIETTSDNPNDEPEEQSFFLETPEYFGSDTPEEAPQEQIEVASGDLSESGVDNSENAFETSIANAPLTIEGPEIAGVETADFSTLEESPVDEAITEAEEVVGLGSVTEDVLADEIEPITLVTPVKITGKVAADDPFAPFIKDPPHIATVAILGASGIGANHAKWFTKHSCHVVSFLGSSDATNAEAGRKMTQEFGFDGQAYTNLEQLLEETKPEIVCVATPSQFHFVHALQALEAGAHVLCEKPLTYAPARKIRENIAGATELIKTAKKKNLLLGTQLQYGAATPILTKLAGVSPEEVGDFAMEIETTNINAPRNPHELWIDLGPHAVSIAAFLGGAGATLVEDSIQFFPRVEGQMVEASARFSIRREDERFVTVRAITRFAPKDAMWRSPYRRFSFNGRVISYRGYLTSSGEYAAQFTAPDGYDSHYPDPVDFLVGNFVRAVHGEEELLIDGEFGRQNLEWLLKING